VEQELLTISEHLSSSPVFNGFVLGNFVFFILAIVTIACPSIYASDYLFGISKLFTFFSLFSFSNGIINSTGTLHNENGSLLLNVY
jgi:hypothetical protein